MKFSNVTRQDVPAAIDHALDGLLQNVQLSRCTTNLGYLHALIHSATLAARAFG